MCLCVHVCVCVCVCVCFNPYKLNYICRYWTAIVYSIDQILRRVYKQRLLTFIKSVSASRIIHIGLENDLMEGKTNIRHPVIEGVHTSWPRYAMRRWRLLGKEMSLRWPGLLQPASVTANRRTLIHLTRRRRRAVGEMVPSCCHLAICWPSWVTGDKRSAP